MSRLAGIASQGPSGSDDPGVVVQSDSTALDAIAVEAVLAGFVVVVGVVFARWWEQRAERRQRIVAATEEVRFVLPLVIAGWIDPTEVDRSLGGEWHNRNDRLYAAMRQIRVDAERLMSRPKWWPTWSWFPGHGPWAGERLHDALDKLEVRVAAIELATRVRGLVPPPSVMAKIHADELVAAAIGSYRAISDALEQVDATLEEWGVPPLKDGGHGEGGSS